MLSYYDDNNIDLPSAPPYREIENILAESQHAPEQIHEMAELQAS